MANAINALHCRNLITVILPLSVSIASQLFAMHTANADEQMPETASAQEQSASATVNQATLSKPKEPNQSVPKRKWKTRVDIGYRRVNVSPPGSPNRNDIVTRVKRWDEKDTWTGEAVHEVRGPHQDNYAWIRNDHYWRKDLASIVKLGGTNSNSSDDIYPRTEAAFGFTKKWGKKNRIASSVLYRVQERRVQPTLNTATAETYYSITDNWYAGVGVSYSRTNGHPSETAGTKNGITAGSGHSWSFDTGYTHYTDNMIGSYEFNVYIEKGTDISNYIIGNQQLTNEPAKSLTATYSLYLTKDAGLKLEYQRDIAVTYGLSGALVGLFRTF